MITIIVTSLFIPLVIVGVELIWRIMRPPKVFTPHAKLFPLAPRSYRYPIVYVEQAFLLWALWVILGLIFLNTLWKSTLL